MSKIGFGELIIILVIALVVLGPDKLPEAGRALGKAVRAVKKFIRETTEELDVMDDVREIRKDIDDIQRDVRTMGTGIEKSVQQEAQKLEETLLDGEKDADARINETAQPEAAKNEPPVPESEEGNQTIQEEKEHG